MRSKRSYQKRNHHPKPPFVGYFCASNPPCNAARGRTSGFCPAGRVTATSPELSPTCCHQHRTRDRCTLHLSPPQQSFEMAQGRDTFFVWHISVGLCHSSSNCCRNLGKKSKEKAFSGVAFRGIEQRELNTWQKDRTNPNDFLSGKPSKTIQAELPCCMTLCGTWGHLLSQHLLCATSILRDGDRPP